VTIPALAKIGKIVRFPFNHETAPQCRIRGLPVTAFANITAIATAMVLFGLWHIWPYWMRIRARKP